MKNAFLIALLILPLLGFGKDEEIDTENDIAPYLHQVICIETLVSIFEPPPPRKSAPLDLSTREINLLQGVANVGVAHSQILTQELSRNPTESDALKLREAHDNLNEILVRVQALLESQIKKGKAE